LKERDSYQCQSAKSAARMLHILYWWAGLKQRFGVETISAVSRILTSISGDVGSGERYSASRWSLMARGLRKPHLSLLLAVDRLTVGARSGAGSAAEFLHPVWTVLATELPNYSQQRLLLEKMPQLIKQVDAAAAKIPVRGGRQLISAPNVRLLRKVEACPSLDSLAYLTVLARRAEMFGLDHVAQRAADSLCRVLWLLGRELQRRGLIERAFEFFDLHVLPKVDGGQTNLGISSADAVWLVDYLDVLARRAFSKGAPASNSPQPSISQLLEVLRGRHGRELQRLFEPVKWPSVKVSDNALALHLELDLRDYIRAIGMARYNMSRLD